MQLFVAAVGQRMPRWVEEAWTEYARRMPQGMSLAIREIQLAKRGKNPDTSRLKTTESVALYDAMPARARIIALDVMGKPWSTKTLADKLSISMETVKLHRKHAYAKLEVSSQAELFYLFLDSVMSAERYDGGDPLVAYMLPPQT